MSYTTFLTASRFLHFFLELVKILNGIMLCYDGLMVYKRSLEWFKCHSISCEVPEFCILHVLSVVTDPRFSERSSDGDTQLTGKSSSEERSKDVSVRARPRCSTVNLTGHERLSETRQ